MNTIIDSLKWRYATKIFDDSKKLTANQVYILKQSINLTASSLGLQPYKVIVVSDKKTKNLLLPHSYNQQQITTASHLFIFCAIQNIDEEFADKFIKQIAKTRNQPISELEGYSSMISGFLSSSNENSRGVWAANQAYIAIGNLLLSCALEGIDSCPMEGFLKEKYDEILSLPEKGLKSLALVAAGYRSQDDKYRHLSKVRKTDSDMFIDI